MKLKTPASCREEDPSMDMAVRRSSSSPGRPAPCPHSRTSASKLSPAFTGKQQRILKPDVRLRLLAHTWMDFRTGLLGVGPAFRDVKTLRASYGASLMLVQCVRDPEASTRKFIWTCLTREISANLQSLHNKCIVCVWVSVQATSSDVSTRLSASMHVCLCSKTWWITLEW